MLKGFSFLLALGLVLGIAGPLMAHPFLTGYSGAPLSYGTCSISCHGYPRGTIYVRGFPDTSQHVYYKPDSTYTIAVCRVPDSLIAGGDWIENFNCCIRIGRTAVTAGLITAGYNTVTYSESLETNGVHALTRTDSCDFLWTAPDTGAGFVTLYFGGFQGIEGEWGRYSTGILVSQEFSGVEEQGNLQPKGDAFGLSLVGANPARGGVALAYRLGSGGPAQLRVYDVVGRQVRSFAVSGSGILRWDGRDAQGTLLPPGVYLFRLEQGNRASTGKVLLIR